MCNYNATVTQAETWTATFEFKNADGTTYSLASYNEAHIQIRKTAGSTVVVEGSIDGGEITKSGNLLTVKLVIPSDISGNYKYDIDLLKADGSVWTPIWGTLKIREQITIQLS